jgi:hypothetical protein
MARPTSCESGARADSEVPEVLEFVVLVPLKRYTPEFWEEVCDVLKQVPTAIARVIVDGIHAIPGLIEAARRHGVDVPRFDFDVQAFPKERHLARLRTGTVVMEPSLRPYGGHIAWRHGACCVRPLQSAPSWAVQAPAWRDIRCPELVGSSREERVRMTMELLLR